MTTQTSGPKRSRETWGSQTGFLIAAIGSAIGLGNIWRFPGVAYTHGKGAFIIPYLVALLCVGIPILLLDYSLGHRFRGSPPLAFRRISKKLEWLGWFQVLVCFIIMVYYAVVIAWSSVYVYYSVGEQWGSDPKTFFFTNFLELPKDLGISHLPVWHIFIPLALLWIFSLFILGRGIQRGVEAANRFFLPLLVVLFVALVVRAIFLPGAIDGLNAFFTPDWGQLGNPSVWIGAFAQIFYSMSVAFGIMLTYSSYLKKRTNLTGTGLVAGFANSAFEILAGIGVFAAIGFMAHQSGTTVDKVEGLTGPTLSFQTFPKLISMMPGGSLFGVLFFSSLVLAGFTSLLSLLQVVSGAFQDKFGLSPAKAAVSIGAVAGVISLGIFSTQSGLTALDVVDKFINEVGVVGSAVMMTLGVAVFFRKLPQLRRHLNKYSSIRIPRLWIPVVGYVVPIVLAYMLLSTVIELIKDGYDDYPLWYVMTFGWGALLLAAVGTALLTLLRWRVDPDEYDPSNEHFLAEEVR